MWENKEEWEGGGGGQEGKHRSKKRMEAQIIKKVCVGERMRGCVSISFFPPPSLPLSWTSL